jgi:hypothetical protein
LKVEQSGKEAVTQVNKVSHTGASGYARLQRQAIFGGILPTGLHYLLVDDFIGQGGSERIVEGLDAIEG